MATLQNISIVLAKEEKEILQVYQMMLAAFAEYDTYNTPSSAMNEKFSVLVEAIEKGEEQAIVSFMDGEPTGSVRFKSYEDSVYFSRLAVKPEARGNGIARAMVDWLLEFVKEKDKQTIFCRVRKDTPQNVAFYERIGFMMNKEETIINKDGNIVDIIVMEKRVDQPSRSFMV